MTKLYNNPADFADDQLEGFVDLYSDRLIAVPGGVISHPPATPQVAVIVGGGSGHYPAFAGLVGPGFASGAVVGNIFTSPSAAHVYSVAKAAHQGKGVVLTFGNYQGDIINFGIAAKMLNAEGIDTRIVVVTDDIASAPEFDKRRGIAGDFTVFKVLSAAAAAGKSLDEVERLGSLANEKTRTLGVAFSGCTMPGADSPLFAVEEGQMGVGLGIHGEPGIRDEPRPSANELGTLLAKSVLAEAPEGAGNRVGLIVNGLGTTKYEELFLLYRTIAPLIREAGYEIVDPEVGELVTSLDMGGVSLTLMWLDDELDELWQADAYACAYRKQKQPLTTLSEPAESVAGEVRPEDIVAPSDAALSISARVKALANQVAELMKEQENYLGEIDAVAGDGDHGRGMVRGTSAAVEAIEKLPEQVGPAQMLKSAGRAWAAQAGGTSGVLWGASLEAAANTLTDDAASYTAEDLVSAVGAFNESMQVLGGAKLGDKTLLDALIPFVEELTSSSANLTEAWGQAAQVAATSAQDSAALVPQKGRARPLAKKSVGNPDPGAISMAMILKLIGTQLP